MQWLHDQARFPADPCKGDGSAARAPAIAFVGFFFDTSSSCDMHFCERHRNEAKSNQGGQRRHFGDETEHFSTSASFSELIMNVYTKLDQASVGDHSKVFLSNTHVTRHEEVPCAIHDVLLQQQTPWNAACLNTKASFIGLYHRIDRLISCAQIHPLFQKSHAATSIPKPRPSRNRSVSWFPEARGVRIDGHGNFPHGICTFIPSMS